MLIATVIDNESKFYWTQFYGVSFQVISIRQGYVLVKSCSDEPFLPPYNVHEFPIEVLEIKDI